MTSVLMNKYGRTLTDRPDGKKAFTKIINENELPVSLDFSGVIAMGSSFGDEVVLKIARLQNDKIVILNANNAIRDCVGKIVEETNVEVSFVSLQRI